MSGVYVAGGISGAHLNPAVTLGLATFRGFPWRKVPGYAAAQILGACVGSILIQANYWNLINQFEGGYGVRTFGEATSTGSLFFTAAQSYMSNISEYSTRHACFSLDRKLRPLRFDRLFLLRGLRYLHSIDGHSCHGRRQQQPSSRRYERSHPAFPHRWIGCFARYPDCLFHEPCSRYRTPNSSEHLWIPIFDLDLPIRLLVLHCRFGTDCRRSAGMFPLRSLDLQRSRQSLEPVSC